MITLDIGRTFLPMFLIIQVKFNTAMHQMYRNLKRFAWEEKLKSNIYKVIGGMRDMPYHTLICLC